MIRQLFTFIIRFFFGPHWRFPQFVVRPPRLLHEKGLVMSTAFVGRQGVGKTYALAVELLEQMKAHPEQSFIIYDWSGGLIIILMLLILSDPKRDELLPRLVYDAMGGRIIDGKFYIMPMPGFSEKYDPEKPWLQRVEDQVDRVVRIFEALNEELVIRNPTVGKRPITGLFPNLLSLANAVKDKNGESWQITEALKLLNPNVRTNALDQFGGMAKKAVEYFRNSFTGESKFDHELESALRDVLDILNSQRVRARVGYPTPGWTTNEAEKKGQIVFVDGSEVNNNHGQKDFLFVQLFFMLKDHLDKRQASRSDYNPINIIADEVYSFNEMPSVSSILAHLPSEYRNRKLQLYLVIQSLKQLAGEKNGKKGLEDMFFSFGNLVVFSLLDIQDCFTMIENLFPFDPQSVKVPSQREGQHDIMENRDEQKAVKAYQLQRLSQRECYVRRFIDEARMDKIIHVGRTRDVLITATNEDVESLKDKLMLERGVLLTEAERIIGQRSIAIQPKPPAPTKEQKKRKAPRT